MTRKKSKSVVCVKCSKNIGKSYFKVQCAGGCRGWSHLDCTGLKAEEKEKLKAGKAVWKCLSCLEVMSLSGYSSSDVDSDGAGGYSNTHSETESDSNSEISTKIKRKSLTAGTSIINDRRQSGNQNKNMKIKQNQKQNNSKNTSNVADSLINKENPSIKDLMKLFHLKFREFEESLNFNGNIMEDLKNSMNNMRKEYKRLKKENEVIKNELTELRNKVAKINSNVKDTINREDRKKQLVFLGVNTTRENCFQDVQKVLNTLGVPLQEDKCWAKMLPSHNAEKPILVSFTNEEDKSKVLEKRKSKGTLTAHECGLSGGDKKIFINMDLTKEVRELFRKARQLRGKGFQFIWCNGTNVLARKAEGDKVMKITSLEQIERLLGK